MEILSLAPSNTEIIYRLGMEEHLIATTSLCDYPEGAAKKPSVGGWSKGVKIDKIIDLNPDIVIASDDLQNQIVNELEDKNLEVLQLKPHTLQGVYDSIAAIGNELDCKSRAGQVVENMKNELSKVNLNSKKIYCEEWMNPPMVSGNWIPGLIEDCNGKYFIAKGGRSSEFDLEKLKEFDPEYIFLNICGAGENIDVAEVLNREKWQSIQAVKDENVYTVDDALLNRPAPRLVEGVKKIEKLIE